MSTVFDTLNALNVNEHTEVKKSGGTELTYLSWTWAWAEVKKRYPGAKYEIWRDERGLPYAFDPNTGYMVFTSVTIEGETHSMWLPVMDGANKAMKDVPYEYSTKYSGKKTVEAATMFDVNKALMRCLVKNLAMFGVGLYIYSGEDLPEGEAEADQKVAVKISDNRRNPDVPKAPAAVCCDDCGGEIKGIKGKDGSWIEAQQIVMIGRSRFGRTLCASCQKTAVASLAK